MLFQGDAPEGSDTFQWPVIERDRVGGLRLIIWDKVKVPLCQYRLMHRKRVTSELHDSYFRLMTIKHSISKIEWASNDYITQLSSTNQLSWVEFEFQCGRESHTRLKGLGALMNWGPEKMLIRCNKESHHLAEWALGLRLSSPGERERHNADGITLGSKYFSYVRSPAPSHMRTLSNPFRILAIKWEVNIVKEVFLRASLSLRQYVSCVTNRLSLGLRKQARNENNKKYI